MNDYEDIDTSPNWLVEQWLLRNSVSTPSNPSIPSDDFYESTKFQPSEKDHTYEDIDFRHHNVYGTTVPGHSTNEFHSYENKNRPHGYQGYRVPRNRVLPRGSVPHIGHTLPSQPTRRPPSKRASSEYAVVHRDRGHQKNPVDAFSEVLDEIKGLSLSRSKKTQSCYDDLDSCEADLEESKDNFAQVIRVFSCKNFNL